MNILKTLKRHSQGVSRSIGNFWSKLRAILKSRRVSQGRVYRLLTQPHSENIGREAEHTYPAAHPPTTQQTINTLYDAPEAVIKRGLIGQIDPQQGITEESQIFGLIDGRRTTEHTTTKVIFAEGTLGTFADAEGICSICVRFAKEIFHCSAPGCERPVCRLHSIALNPKNPSIRFCPSCFEKHQFHRNTWVDPR